MDFVLILTYKKKKLKKNEMSQYIYRSIYIVSIGGYTMWGVQINEQLYLLNRLNLKQKTTIHDSNCSWREWTSDSPSLYTDAIYRNN